MPHDPVDAAGEGEAAPRPPLPRPTRRQWIGAFVFLLAVCAGLLAVTVLFPRSPQLLANGSAAPAVRLADTSGAAHDVLATGRPVVIEFFETTCPTCQAQQPAMCAYARAHPGVDVVAIDAALESTTAVTGYARDRASGCRETFLLDPGLQVSHQYLVSVVPTVYLVDASGRISYGGTGASGIGGLDAATAALSRG